LFSRFSALIRDFSAFFLHFPDADGAGLLEKELL